ncbi:IS1/IS1595 family N-terminal zinc-binding domain-containing protein [Bifidobacterium mongoliense]|uniref:IS1/IS1595 family N-terminal zinc-binding domain-containing protein n=2 Tax=Bifidobacterium mongoliense TaxID=518643 RepID=UPI003BEF2132
MKVCVKHAVSRFPGWGLGWFITLLDFEGMKATMCRHCGTIMHRNGTTSAGTARWRCPNRACGRSRVIHPDLVMRDFDLFLPYLFGAWDVASHVRHIRQASRGMAKWSRGIWPLGFRITRLAYANRRLVSGYRRLASVNLRLVPVNRRPWYVDRRLWHGNRRPLSLNLRLVSLNRRLVAGKR